MINQVNHPINPMRQQEALIQQLENGEGISQEEFEALQAAIVASMVQDE